MARIGSKKSAAIRERAVLAVLSEKSLASAAVRAGISERTLSRWLADDEEFKQQLADARRVAFDAGMSRVRALVGKAIDTVEELLGPETSAAVRLGAARTIAELGLHERDAEVILRKLDQIESAQRGR